MKETRVFHVHLVDYIGIDKQRTAPELSFLYAADNCNGTLSKRYDVPLSFREIITYATSERTLKPNGRKLFKKGGVKFFRAMVEEGISMIHKNYRKKNLTDSEHVNYL